MNALQFIKNGMKAVVRGLVTLLLLFPLPGRGQEADTLLYLPLPDVPSSLRTPETRANYIVSHFWDALDFKIDTLKTRNSDFMERNLANYLSLFPIADTMALVTAVETLATNTGEDAQSLSVLVELVEKYLYEPESPFYNEEHYEIFLDAFLHAPVHEYERMRLTAQWELIRKSRPGTVAADFTYETPAGERMRMRETGKGKPLLLLFYEPDCGHCMEVMEELKAMESLQAMVSRGELTVLAVFPGFDDLQIWRRTLGNLPSAWKVGFNDGTIYTEDLYVMRRMPALYLLDEHRRVIARDLSQEQLAGLIDEMMNAVSRTKQSKTSIKREQTSLLALPSVRSLFKLP